MESSSSTGENSGAGGSDDAPNAESGGLQRVFYCHQCLRRTFPNAEHIQNFTCMNCDSGFIEDVTIREDSPSSQSDDQSWGAAAAIDAAIAETMENFVENLDNWDNNDASGASSSASSSQSSRSTRQQRPRTRARVQLGQTGAGGQLADQFIHTLIANLIGGARGQGGFDGIPGAIHIAGPGRGQGGAGGGAFPAGLFQVSAGPGGGGGGAVPFMPLYGNPGDYAWGRGGLDAIVTQLLNQMDGTGPPPMSVDEIKKIPTIKVTQKQIDDKIQCSVCWDDFKLDEEVRQLKCEHIFHTDCIIPWLELHNTCPVCRKEQEQETTEKESSPSSSQDPAPPSVSGSSSSGQQGSGDQQRGDLMDAIGRSMSIMNSIFGLPPESTPSSDTGSNAATTTTPSSSSSANPPSTSASSTVTSSASTTTSTSSRNNDDSSTATATANPGGGNNQQFQDMDLE